MKLNQPLNRGSGAGRWHKELCGGNNLTTKHFNRSIVSSTFLNYGAFRQSLGVCIMFFPPVSLCCLAMDCRPVQDVLLLLSSDSHQQPLSPPKKTTTQKTCS